MARQRARPDAIKPTSRAIPRGDSSSHDAQDIPIHHAQDIPIAPHLPHCQNVTSGMYGSSDLSSSPLIWSAFSRVIEAHMNAPHSHLLIILPALGRSEVALVGGHTRDRRRPLWQFLEHVP